MGLQDWIEMSGAHSAVGRSATVVFYRPFWKNNAIDAVAFDKIN
jgi:hypothetical protein